MTCLYTSPSAFALSSPDDDMTKSNTLILDRLRWNNITRAHKKQSQIVKYFGDVHTATRVTFSRDGRRVFTSSQEIRREMSAQPLVKDTQMVDDFESNAPGGSAGSQEKMDKKRYENLVILSVAPKFQKSSFAIGSSLTHMGPRTCE